MNGTSSVSIAIIFRWQSIGRQKRAFSGAELRRRSFAKSTAWIILKLAESKLLSVCHRVRAFTKKSIVAFEK